MEVFSMYKSEVYKYPANSAEFVVAHARWQKARGRKPSMPFMGHQNPTAALSLARRFAYFPASGIYLNGEVPTDYKCVKCGETNCKLWREYNTFLEHQRLLCAPCCGADQEKDITGIDADGRIPVEHIGKTDQIGWMVPAVPTEERDTYWGYTSVPLAGCEWWKKLPSLPPTTDSVKKSVQPVIDIKSIDIQSSVSRWCKNQFILRASFYTGRGVNNGDLNSRYMEMIYQGLKTEVCQAAATNFAKFTNQLKDLTASAFIQAFEEFWYGGCQVTDANQRKGTGYQISGRGDNEKMTEAFVLFANAFGGRQATIEEVEQDSVHIKSEFVHKHQNEIRG